MCIYIDELCSLAYVIFVNLPSFENGAPKKKKRQRSDDNMQYATCNMQHAGIHIRYVCYPYELRYEGLIRCYICPGSE